MSTPDVAAPSEDLASLQALVRRYGSELNERDVVSVRTGWEPSPRCVTFPDMRMR